MLSLNRGKPFATAINKDGKREFIIYTREDNGDPDIKVDNPIELITKADIDGIKKSLKLGNIEVGIIKKFLKENPTIKQGEKNYDMSKLTMKLRRSVEILLDLVKDKLKKELDLSLSSENLRLLPLMGKNKLFDRSFYICGSSESGKSFFIKDVLTHADFLNRPVILFSSIESDDSLEELKEQKTAKDKKPKLIQIPLLAPDDAMHLPAHSDLQGCITVFDDIDSLQGFDFAEFVRQYRDKLLLTGRHNKISVMSTSHQVSNYNKTKHLLTEAEWVVLFPASSKTQTMKFLRNSMGMEKKDMENIIANATKHGRFLAIKMSAPQLLMTAKLIRLL